MINVVKGDLFKSGAPAIGHGVNCKGVMGSGIATVFKINYPDMYEEYKGACRRGDLRPGMVFPWKDEESGVWIYNIASQDNPGADARLDWLATGVAKALDHAFKNDVYKIALPKIGCGIGGLDWEDVHKSLSQVERNRVTIIEVYEL